MQNLWRELRSGPDVPHVVYTIVEIPKGSRNKYEYQKANGVIFLDRVLYSSLHYPGDYGLIPQTFYDDGDPLDILLMINEPTFPGCIMSTLSTISLSGSLPYRYPLQEYFSFQTSFAPIYHPP